MLLGVIESTELMAIIGGIGTIAGAVGVWVLKYKNGQLDYLFEHFRGELKTIKEDVVKLKDSARLAETNEARCREEMAGLKVELEYLRKPGAHQ